MLKPPPPDYWQKAYCPPIVLYVLESTNWKCYISVVPTSLRVRASFFVVQSSVDMLMRGKLPTAVATNSNFLEVTSEAFVTETATQYETLRGRKIIKSRQFSKRLAWHYHSSPKGTGCFALLVCKKRSFQAR